MKIDIAQARKKAKELVKSGEVATLAEGQLRVARELGHASWPAFIHAVAEPGTFFPGPGEFRTYALVWDVDDPTKAGDPRYWWLSDEVERMRRVVQPQFADTLPVAGTPKGQSLESTREEFGGDTATFEPFAEEVSEEEAEMVDTLRAKPMELSLSRWSDCDPRKTYLIFSHARGATAEEREREERSASLPPEIDALRREWVAALDAGDESEPRLREQYEAELKSLGHVMHREFSPLDPSKAVEVSPGVFVQDERPDQP